LYRYTEEMMKAARDLMASAEKVQKTVFDTSKDLLESLQKRRRASETFYTAEADGLVSVFGNKITPMSLKRRIEENMQTLKSANLSVGSPAMWANWMRTPGMWATVDADGRDSHETSSKSLLTTASSAPDLVGLDAPGKDEAAAHAAVAAAARSRHDAELAALRREVEAANAEAGRCKLNSVATHSL
jgi:hypothetical protein